MNKKMLIIIIAAVVVVLAAAAVVVVFVLNSKEPEEKPPVFTDYSLTPAFVTNVKDSKSLFRCSIVLVLEGENAVELEEEISSENARLRDTIIFTLRELSEDDIRGANIRDELSNKLLTRIHEALEMEFIVDIYFDDFIMQ